MTDSVTGNGDGTPSSASDSVTATEGADSITAATGADADTLSSGRNAGPWGTSALGSDSAATADADDTLAGGEGADTLAGASGTDTVPEADTLAGSDPVSDDHNSDPTPSAAKPAKKKSGGGGFLVFVILVGLVAVGLYMTYPHWRGLAEPYAAQIGVELPAVEMAGSTAPTTDSGSAASSTTTAGSQEPASPEPTGAEPASDPAPEPNSIPETESASAASVTALEDRLAALEAEVAELKQAPPPAVPAAAGPDQAAIAQMIDEATKPLKEALNQTSRKLAAVSDEVAIIREVLGQGDGAANGGEDGDGVGPLAAALSEKVQTLTEKVAELESSEPDPVITPSQLQSVADQVTTLTTAFDTKVAEAASARSELADRMDKLDAALSDMNASLATIRSQSEKDGAFLLAANQLALEAARSGAFQAALNAVKAVEPTDSEAVTAAISAIEPLTGGVPSRTALRDRFSTVSARILDAAVVGSGDGVVDRALQNIASLVTVRRTTTDGGDSIDGLVASAESALRAGDLQAAVDTLSGLDGAPAEAAAAWLQAAGDRLALDQAVSTIQSAAIAGLSGS